jgi:two-component system, OmpR family, response regulator BaeR
MAVAGSRILVVEDEPRIAAVLMDYLRQAGFIPTHVADGQSAVPVILADPPALVLLDVMLPNLDGMEICRRVRAATTVPIPIIMVTARAEEIDRLLGLELGADDYICKPFSPREVVARVKAVLRRTQGGGEAGEAAPVSIDDEACRIQINGQSLDLTPTEFRILRLLASRPGRVYSRADILDLAYGDDEEVSDRVIDSHIKNIRRKVAKAAPDRDLVHSVYGMGYRFEAT